MEEKELLEKFQKIDGRLQELTGRAERLEGRASTVEKTLRMVFLAIQQLESKHRIKIMPKGEYYGVKFA